jgi:hypothetical protein
MYWLSSSPHHSSMEITHILFSSRFFTSSHPWARGAEAKSDWIGEEPTQYYYWMRISIHSAV